MSGTSTPDVIQDPYGPRTLSGVYDYHRGVDFWGKLGDPVHAVADGVVVRMQTAEENAGTGLQSFGNWVLVEHAPLADGTPLHTAYLHLYTFDVVVGDTLLAGSPIGTINSSGVDINTDHLHLNLYYGLSGTLINKRRSVSPWRILPNPGLDEVVLEIVSDTTIHFGARISELDLVRVEVTGRGAGTGKNKQTFDFIDFETEEGLCGDNPECEGVRVIPDDFYSFDEWATWDVVFTTVGPITGACLYDVDGLVEVVGKGCPASGGGKN